MDQKKVISEAKTLHADLLTPFAVYLAVRKFGQMGYAERESAFFESMERERQGRYSIIATEPFARFSCKDLVSTLEPIANSTIRKELSDNPLAHLENCISGFTPEKHDIQVPFQGGTLGYFGYPAVRLVEPTVPRHRIDDFQLADIDLLFFSKIIVFDHMTNRMHIIAIGPEENGVPALKDKIRQVEDCVKYNMPSMADDVILGEAGKAEIASNLTKGQYCDMVEKAKKYIASGDIFQVVLSQRFEADFPYSGINFYRILRKLNPSPYMFIIDYGKGLQLIGASPEVMVRVMGGDVLIRPLAGTRKRGKSSAEDETLMRELTSDPKEIAEHRMLVDLARNDIGRSCKSGSIRIVGPLRAEIYGPVIHMVTDVIGRLARGVSPLKALFGCFHAGTLTGAPKVRAMEIIAELESLNRGPYGGVVGWFTPDALDTCIFIRSALVKDGKIYWQAGGGIVADSVPKKEYEESFAKSGAIRRVLGILSGRSNKKGGER